MILLALACTGEEPVPPTPAPATPPPTVPWVDTGVYRPQQTGNVVLDDDVPDNTIQVEHTGFWERSGSPYDAIVGELHVREIIDGYVPATADTGDVLDCDVSWFVTGTPDLIVHTCAGCGPSWAVSFTYDTDSVSTIDACADVELPDDGDVWHLAFHPGDGVIYFNYYGTGVWMPWWDAEENGARVDYGWTGELAFAVEEEEE